MSKPKPNPNPRKTVLDHIARSCPTTLAIARQILDEFPSRHPAVEPCWPYLTKGLKSARPFMQIRPHSPGHPIRYFFETSYRRICQHHRCVNPHHFMRVPRAATVQPHPLIWDAMDAMEADPPISLDAALAAFRDDYGAPSVVNAYRNLREDRLL
jgi:hypothetical protein